MNKLLFAGGFGVAAAALSFGLVYNYFFKSHRYISKEDVIKKLMITKQELYPVMFQISYLISKQMAPKGVSPDQARLYILQNPQSGIKQKIQTILNEKVYHDIDQPSFQHAVQNTFKGDKQVQFYKNSFQQQFQKCFLGIQPSMEVITISVLSKQKVIDLVKQLLKEKIRKTKLLYQRIKDKQQLIKQLAKTNKQDQAYRQNCLTQIGTKTANKVSLLQFSIQKFLDDKSFKNQYQAIIQSYKTEIQYILQSHQQQNQLKP